MNDRFLVRVLDRFANLDEKFQSLADSQPLFIAIIRDGQPVQRTPLQKNGCPSLVVPASNTFAIDGWFMIASDCRSD